MTTERMSCPSCAGGDFWLMPDGRIICGESECYAEYGTWTAKPPPAGNEFRPDWCLAPSALLREWLGENNLALTSVALIGAGRGGDREAALAQIQEVLDRKPLLMAHAEVLARATMISARFWMSYEHNYRAGLAVGLIDTTDDD